MTLRDDTLGHELGWWKAQLEGGPRDGREAPLAAPYPFVDVPEGRYRRRGKPGPKPTTLTYVWTGDDD